MFPGSRNVMAIAIMIAASGTAAADTFYLECTTTPNTMGVPMVGGLGCRQVPSHLIIRLPEADPSAQAPLPQEGASTEATPIDAPDTAPPKTEEADRQPLLTEVAAPVETVSPQAERPKPSELPSNEASAPQNVEPKPSESPSAETSTPSMDGPVRPGETIYRVAAKVFPNDTHRLDDVVAALVRENPSAFIHGDPNRIKAGATLKIPAPEDIQPAPRKRADAPAPSAPSSEVPPPAKGEPKPGILVLPGGSKSQPAPAQAPAQAPDAKDEAKKELMKEIEAIRKQMMEINNQLLESGGG